MTDRFWDQWYLWYLRLLRLLDRGILSAYLVVCLSVYVCERQTEKGTAEMGVGENKGQGTEPQRVANLKQMKEGLFSGDMCDPAGDGEHRIILGGQLSSTITFLAGFFTRLSVIVRQLKLSCRAFYRAPGKCFREETGPCSWKPGQTCAESCLSPAL